MVLHSGRIIAVQASAAAAVAAWSAGAVPLALVAPVALATVAAAVVRVRGTWASAWLALFMGYVVRRHRSPRSALAGLASPQTLDLDGDPVALITDSGGPTAILALGEPDSLLGDPGPALPELSTLAQPDVRLRLVVSCVAAPAPGVRGPAATAYRQLTAGTTPGYRRALLAVQVRRVPGYDEATLRRMLAGSLRQLRRRLKGHGIPARALGPGALTGVLAELTHDDAGATAERWSGLTFGGRHHVAFRLADTTGDTETVSVAARLLALQGCAVTLALACEGDAVDTYVRLTATDAADLAIAVDAFHNQLTAAGVGSVRLDGAQVNGFTSTLPLGPPAAPRPGRQRQPTDLVIGGCGVMLGTNRHGEPVVARLFRGEPTRVVLVGPPARARLVVLRALAMGASLFLQTGQPDQWDPFVRAIGSNAPITVTGTGRRFEAPPATLLRPQLVVLDVGAPALGPPPLADAAWRTTLVVRDEITDADVDPLARADLAVLAPVSEAEAVLAGAALGLGGNADWLARIRGDIIGAAVPRRTVRWAMASPTPLELQLIGPTHSGGVGEQ
jgi:type VII secretion protein EccE